MLTGGRGWRAIGRVGESEVVKAVCHQQGTVIAVSGPRNSLPERPGATIVEKAVRGTSFCTYLTSFFEIEQFFGYGFTSNLPPIRK